MHPYIIIIVECHNHYMYLQCTSYNVWKFYLRLSTFYLINKHKLDKAKYYVLLLNVISKDAVSWKKSMTLYCEKLVWDSMYKTTSQWQMDVSVKFKWLSLICELSLSLESLWMQKEFSITFLNINMWHMIHIQNTFQHEFILNVRCDLVSLSQCGCK